MQHAGRGRTYPPWLTPHPTLRLKGGGERKLPTAEVGTALRGNEGEFARASPCAMMAARRGHGAVSGGSMKGMLRRLARGAAVAVVALLGLPVALLVPGVVPRPGAGGRRAGVALSGGADALGPVRLDLRGIA